MKTTWLFALFALLAIGFVGWGALQNSRSFASSAETIPVVKAVNNNVIAEAKVVPIRYATLGLLQSGTVKAILVDEGDSVADGQALLQLKDDALISQVNRQIAVLSGVRARLAEAQAGTRRQEIEIVRASCDIAKVKLANLPANISQEVRDIAATEVRRCLSQLDLLEEGTRPETIAGLQAEENVAKSAVFEARTLLADSVVKAPFAGTVAAVNVQVAEQVQAGVPLIQLGDLSAWQIETDDLSELDIARVRVGDAVKVRIDGIPDIVMDGKVKTIKPFGVIQAGDVTYQVIVALEKYDERLYWNMSASVEIEVGRN